MPWVPVQVEKLRNHTAIPTIRPSRSATWAYTRGSAQNRWSRNDSAVASTASGARS